MVKLSFVIFPIIFAAGYVPSAGQTALLMDLFCLSCTCAMLFCIINGSYQYFFVNIGNKHWLIYELLASPLMHPGYLSNFYLFGLCWLAMPTMNYQYAHTIFSTRARFAMASLFVVFIGLLTSKTAFIILILFAALFILHAVNGNFTKQQRRNLIVAALASVLAVLAIVRLFLWGRFSFVAELISPEQYGNTHTSVGSRWIAWREGLLAAKKHLLFGTGTGTANQVLAKSFEQKGYVDFVKFHMHTHQQLIHTLLDLGIGGLLLLLGIFTIIAIQFIRTRNYYGVGVMVIIVLNLLTDDCLEIQACLVPFVFFMSLFLFGQISWAKTAELSNS
jgi:O-antigen ligase